MKKSIFSKTTETLKVVAKEKISEKKNDPILLALYALEFFLTLSLVGGMFLYLDGRFNTIEFPFNLMMFAAIAYIVMRLYKYTESFRQFRGLKRHESLKTFSLEFIIFIIIVASAFVYQDPAINIVPYPFNFLVFLLILSIPLYFYIYEKYLKK